VVLELLSLTRLPVAAPISPAEQNTTGKMQWRRRPVKDPVVISFFSFDGVFASFPGLSSELLKCITNHRKIVKMQTQLIWNLGKSLYLFMKSHFGSAIIPVKFEL
jgi:hypothetical protein